MGHVSCMKNVACFAERSVNPYLMLVDLNPKPILPPINPFEGTPKPYINLYCPL